MVQVCFAGEARLSLVDLCGKDVSASYRIYVRVGVVGLDPLDYVFKANRRHGNSRSKFTNIKSQINSKLQYSISKRLVFEL
jgi:hypothetical protein